jgi:hypothetical protein
MTPESYKTITENINSQSMPLRQLHAAARDSGSTWSVDQLHLLLSCLDDWRVTYVGSEWIVERAGRSLEEELEDAIVAAVQSQGGRPMPAGVIMSLLPNKFATSEVQIRKVAKHSQRLLLLGPGLIGSKG